MQFNVDLTKFKSKIAEARQQIATLVVQGKKVAFDTPKQKIGEGLDKAKQKMKEFKDSFRSGSSQIVEAGQKIDKQNQNITKGLIGVSGQAKQAISFIATMMKGLLNPWTLLIVAITSVYKTFSYFYNKLTVSISELIQKSQAYISWVDKEIEKTNEEKKAAEDLVKVLQKLASKVVLNNSEQLYAQSIIDKLNEKYKGLKLTIDKVTGSIVGLKQAQAEISRQDEQNQIDALNSRYNVHKFNAQTLMKDLFDDKDFTLDDIITGRGFFSFAQKYMPTWLGGASDFEMKEFGARWNYGTLADRLEVLQDFVRKYANDDDAIKKANAAIEEFQQLVKIEEERNDFNSPSSINARAEARVQGELDRIEKEADQLGTKNYKARKQLQAAKEKDKFEALSLEDQLKTLSTQADATKAEIESITSQVDTAAAEIGIRLDKVDEMAKKAEMEKNRIIAVDDQISAIDERQRTLQMQIGRRRADVLNQMPGASEAVLKSKWTDAGRLYDYEGYVKPRQDELNALRQKRQKMEQERNRLAAEFTDLSNELADIEVKFKESGLDYQEILQKLITLQQKLYDTEKQWQAKNAERLAQEQAQLDKYQKVLDFFRKGQQSVQNQLLRKQGNERQAIINETRATIEQDLGRKLDETKDANLIKAAEDWADIQMALKGLDNQIKPQSDQVYSNELARMGGFSSSIVVDRMDVNRQILNANRKSNDYLNTINTGIQDINKNLML